MKYPLLIGLALAVAGCAGPNITQMSSAQLGASTTVTRDEFRKTLQLAAKPIRADGPGAYTYQLAAVKHDGQEAEAYVLFDTYRGFATGWAFWESAVDLSGRELHLEVLRQDAEQFGIHEVVSVDLTKDYLEGGRGTGLRLRVDGKNAQQILYLPPNYISSFLDRLAQL